MFDTVKTVDIREVNLENDFFKLSRNRIDDQLKQSVRNWGLIELPVLLRGSSSEPSPDDHDFTYHYHILFGHNRLWLLQELNITAVTAIISDRVDPDHYLHRALLKGLRGEIGPIGKVKLLSLLRNFLNVDEKVIAQLCRNLQIPDFISRNESFIHAIQDFPAVLRDYLDSRNVGYRIIRNILRLESDDVILLGSWLERINFRINYFKDLVDCMVDIRIRDGDCVRLQALAVPDEKGEREEFLFEEVFRIRYPEYSELRGVARTLIHSLERKGVEVDFPRYFENDRIIVKIPVTKREGSSKIVEKFKGIDLQEIDTLLSLL